MSEQTSSEALQGTNDQESRANVNRGLSEASVKAIETQRDEARGNFNFVWTEYMKWFSFFCTFNLTALAFVHTVGVNRAFSPIATAFVVIDFFGAGSSIFVCRYSFRCSRHYQRAETELRKYAIPEDEKDIVASLSTGTLPSLLGGWASLVNSVVTIIFLVIWALIFSHGIQVYRKTP